MRQKRQYKGGWFKFWIRSNRGTDSEEYKHIDGPVTKSEIKDILEDWCDTFGAWHHSDNFVEYGFRRVSPSKLPKRIRDREVKRKVKR